MKKARARYICLDEVGNKQKKIRLFRGAITLDGLFLAFFLVIFIGFGDPGVVFAQNTAW